MYEYKIQMKRCMNKAKEGGKSITQANDNDRLNKFTNPLTTNQHN